MEAARGEASPDTRAGQVWCSAEHPVMLSAVSQFKIRTSVSGARRHAVCMCIGLRNVSLQAKINEALSYAGCQAAACADIEAVSDSGAHCHPVHEGSLRIGGVALSYSYYSYWNRRVVSGWHVWPRLEPVLVHCSSPHAHRLAMLQPKREARRQHRPMATRPRCRSFTSASNRWMW